MKRGKIAERNTRLFRVSQFFQSLIFVIPIWIAYEQKFLSPSEIAILVGWGQLVQLVGELPTGAFADLVGKKWSVVVAYSLAAASYLLMPWVGTFGMFLFVETLSGLGNAFASGAQEALLYDSLKQDGKEKTFSEVLAQNGFLYQVGLVISTALGGVMYEVNNLLPYYACGVGALVVIGITVLMEEPVVDSEKFSWTAYVEQIKRGLREIVKSAETRVVSAYYIAVGSITWMFQTFFGPYLMIELGYGDSFRGYLGAGLRLFNALVLMRIIKDVRLFTQERTFWFFPIIMSVTLLPGLWLEGYGGIPALAGLMMASTARWIVLAKYTNGAYESKYRATAISALSMGINLIYVGGTAVAGPLMTNFGGVRGVMTMLGVVTALGVVPLTVKLTRQFRHET